MKATLSADGTLTIAPESELEAYALGHWLVAGKRGKHGCLAVKTEVQPTVVPWATGTGAYYTPPLYTLSDSTSASAGTCP